VEGGEDWPTVKIGVRIDARPFAWREDRPEQPEGDSAGTGAEGDADATGYHSIYRGFLVKLCTHAVRDAGFRFELVDVSAEERKGFLELLKPKGEGTAASETDDGETPEAGAGANGQALEIDLLCDPTTISLSRMYLMQDSEAWIFSPIVFVSNSSFVEWTAPLGRASPIPGTDSQHTGSTNPGTAPPDCGGGAPVDGMPQPFAGYVTGTTALDALRAAQDLGVIAEDVRACEFTNHRDGMEAICRGGIRYYFGDVDIISSYQRLFDPPEKSSTDRVRLRCDLTYNRNFLTYEPYAFLVGKGPEGEGFRHKFVRELYRLFSDGTVEREYDVAFENRSKSAALSMLFLINGVPFGPSLRPEVSAPAETGVESETPATVPATEGADAADPEADETTTVSSP
jgi:hypothetical protein